MKNFQGGGKMAIEKVREYFKGFGLDSKILEFDVSSATVELAAKALNVEGKRIAKTLSFRGKDGSAFLVVSAGDAKIDNAKFKHTFLVKAKMLTPDEVLAETGHAVGGVCPFAVPAGVKTYIDSSVYRFETVFPACGSSNSAIELTPDELYKYANAVSRVDVCKLPETEE